MYRKVAIAAAALALVGAVVLLVRELRAPVAPPQVSIPPAPASAPPAPQRPLAPEPAPRAASASGATAPSEDLYETIQASSQERQRLDESLGRFTMEMKIANELKDAGQIDETEWNRRLAQISEAERERARQILGARREEILHQGRLARAQDLMLSRQVRRGPR